MRVPRPTIVFGGAGGALRPRHRLTSHFKKSCSQLGLEQRSATRNSIKEQHMLTSRSKWTICSVLSPPWRLRFQLSAETITTFDIPGNVDGTNPMRLTTPAKSQASI